MTTAGELNLAKQIVRELLMRLLGPSLPGVNAFGISLDKSSGERVVKIDFDPAVEPKIRKSVPSSVGNVKVRVEESRLAEFE